MTTTAPAKYARIAVRLKPKAKERLRKYALQLSSERGRHVSMVKALERILLNLPLKSARRKAA